MDEVEPESLPQQQAAGAHIRLWLDHYAQSLASCFPGEGSEYSDGYEVEAMDEVEPESPPEQRAAGAQAYLPPPPPPPPKWLDQMRHWLPAEPTRALPTAALRCQLLCAPQSLVKRGMVVFYGHSICGRGPTQSWH